MAGTTTRRGRGRPARGELAATITSGNPLQLLVRDRMLALGPEGTSLSLAQVVERAGTKTVVEAGQRRRTPRLSKATLSLILHGKIVNLRPATVEALAKALEVPAETLQRAIDQTRDVKFELPDRAKKLSPEGWAQVLQMVDFLLEREGKAK